MNRPQVPPKADAAPHVRNPRLTPAGWQRPLPEALPKPSVWPAVVGLGACLLAAGLVTSWLVSAVGLALFVAGSGGWVADLRQPPG